VVGETIRICVWDGRYFCSGLLAQGFFRRFGNPFNELDKAFSVRLRPDGRYEFLVVA